MENKGLIFIPDISGFTRFVSQIEIEHSRLIIQELLEIIIDANYTGLEISEIEGDAILFYKFGERPSLNEVYSQVEKMFSAFHRSLLAYERQKYCQCNTCLSAVNLTLKVITHYGEFAGYKVKNFNKLIGKDIIVAHQLLKNEIASHEYWLVTDELANNNTQPDLPKQLKWLESIKNTEERTIPFRYVQLAHLKSAINTDPPASPDLSTKIKATSFSKEYDTDLITLFHATGDFNYRPRWVDGLEKVEIGNHFLPRMGMKCRLFYHQGEKTIYSSHYSNQGEIIEFSEIEEDTGIISYYILEKIAALKTKLTIEFYIKKEPFAKLKFSLAKELKLRAGIGRSLKNLSDLVMQLGDSVRRKSAQDYN